MRRECPGQQEGPRPPDAVAAAPHPYRAAAELG